MLVKFGGGEGGRDSCVFEVGPGLPELSPPLVLEESVVRLEGRAAIGGGAECMADV